MHRFFSAPESWTGIFDIVVSFGVVEHFQDTERCIARISRFLKPRGVLITIIPNLTGLMGAIQKFLNRDIFNIHVPLSKKNLDKAHRASGLQVITCNYFLFANFGVLSLENLKKNSLWEWILPLRSRANRAIWVFEKIIPFLKPNRLSSPYNVCVAVKP
jgi:2-polyprenyl-3-methyl-5-hydroxy-6-metoxy-1,4-benzoquinol methylase